jgi:hypothetical protein
VNPGLWLIDQLDGPGLGRDAGFTPQKRTFGVFHAPAAISRLTDHARLLKDLVDAIGFIQFNNANL